MFNKIEIPSSWKEEYTKYPNGKTIWEALSAAMTSFNDFVDEVNEDVQEGILSIDQAEDTLRGELNASFSTLEEAYEVSFTALQDEVDAAVASVADKVTQAQLDAVNAQLAEKVNSVNGVLPDVNGNVTIATGGIPAQEAWITPTLLNGWTQFQAVGYYKDSLGIVHLKGIITSGTIGQDVFVLPVGYRPLNNYNNFPVKSASVVGGLSIRGGGLGTVRPANGSAAEFCLDGVSFRAEA